MSIAVVWFNCPWLSGYLSESGYAVVSDGIGGWTVTNLSTGVVNDADDILAVEVLIVGFDPLPYAHDDKADEIKKHASGLVGNIFSFMHQLDPNTGESDVGHVIDWYKLITAIILSIIPAARDTLHADLQGIKGIRDTAVGAIAVINAMTDWELVMAYDVVNTPIWS